MNRPSVLACLDPEGPHESLRAAPVSRVREVLAGPGLWFDYGALALQVRSDSAALAEQLKAVYGVFPLTPAGAWADLHVEIRRPRTLRRWLAPQVVFRSDQQEPFEPFPATSPLPLLEWGGNWLIGQQLHNLLLLHAGTVERDGRALLLPAVPGSGKSTLTAALSLRGWRLLSDEFGAFDTEKQAFVPLLKPTALKNESIDVISRFAPKAALGPRFPKTRKGTVAHLGADAQAFSRRHELAKPGAVILPRWIRGSATKLEPLTPQRQFASLAFNSFNYAMLGDDGFRAVVGLVRQCPCWSLVYSDLDSAIAAIDKVWAEDVVAAAVARGETWA